MHNVIKLIELSNTWQGEGPDTGRQMLLARFKYCDRHCKWCDTWVRMHVTAEGSYNIDDINLKLSKIKGLMITGGEPGYENSNKNIYNFTYTKMLLNKCNYQVCNIETNGCNIYKLIDFCKKECINKNIKIIYSPKIFTSEDLKDANEITTKIYQSDNNVYFKYVVDIDSPYTEQYIKKLGECFNKDRVYLMPKGISKEEIQKNLPICLDYADQYECNISTRLHIIHEFI